jgi:hypothetical protein
MDAEKIETLVVATASVVFGVLALVQPGALRLDQWSAGMRRVTAILALLTGLALIVTTLA